MQFLKDGERSGKHRHMWEELFFVVEGSGYDLHWDLKWDCVEAFDWQWAEAPKRYEWTRGDYVYTVSYTHLRPGVFQIGFVLVVAHHDQRIEPGAVECLAEMRHCGAHLVLPRD